MRVLVSLWQRFLSLCFLNCNLESAAHENQEAPDLFTLCRSRALRPQELAHEKFLLLPGLVQSLVLLSFSPRPWPLAGTHGSG